MSTNRIPVDAIEQIKEECLHLVGLPLDDVGPIVCRLDINSGAPLVKVSFLGRHPVYMLDDKPFDPERIANRMREYLSPRPSIGQMVEVFDDCDQVTVTGIDYDKHTFTCETKAGDKRGPYRFGDMMILWRKE